MLTFPSHLVDALPQVAAARNASLLSIITPTTLDPPFYYTSRRNIFDCINDRALSLLAPIAIYWVLSTIFHILDTLELPYFERHRIHPSAEVERRNRATLWQVLYAVIFQQIVQTVFGYVILDSDEVLLRTEVLKDHMGAMKWYAPRVADLTFLVLGPRFGQSLLESYGAKMVNFAYWWAVPAFQLFAGL